MRAFVLFACGAATLGVVVACAESDRHEQPSSDAGPVDTVIPDAAHEIDSGAEASVPRPTCSKAGWCAMALPDEDLTLLDVWPLANRAFAIATSPTLGTKILEWSEVDRSDGDPKWRYIDDGTQNEPGVGEVAGAIWAPSEDEIYYGVSPRFVYHGKRAPSGEPGSASTWTWARSTLPHGGSNAQSPVGVWGTGPTDVYAWFTNTVYHLKNAGEGAGDWDSEYVADDTESQFESFLFTSAAGTSADDVWFSGGRVWGGGPNGCSIVVRKTGAGYRRLADAIMTYDTALECTPRPGTVMIGDRMGALRDLQAVAAGQLVGLKGQRDIVRITAAGDSIRAELAPPLSATVNLYDSDSLDSVWGVSQGLWASGGGIVIRGTDVWDGGGYAVSSIALGDRLFRGTIRRVRGSSDKNLWAVGTGTAFHKTTP